VAGNRAEYGSLANRLEYTVSNLMNVAEFTTSARSRIEDADFAAESARLAKAQGTAANRYRYAGSSQRLIATGNPADPIGSNPLPLSIPAEPRAWRDLTLAGGSRPLQLKG
jgi:hypothetical protein